jgi:hypothetical protein
MRKILATTFVFLLFSVVTAGAQTVTVEALSSPIPLIDATTSSFPIPGDVGTAQVSSVTGTTAPSGLGFAPTSPPYNGTGPSMQPYFAAWNGEITLQFTDEQSNFSMLWGSIDPSNTIEFFNSVTSTTVPIFTISGQQLHDTYDNSIVYGGSTGASTRKVGFAFSSNTFNSIEFIGSTTDHFALEFNVVASPVPGPIPGAGLLSYIALGLLGLGSYGWKRLRAA